jgi:hypothetical protein
MRIEREMAAHAAALTASRMRAAATGGTALPAMCTVRRWLSGRRVSAGNDIAARFSFAVSIRIRSPSTTAQRSRVVIVPIGRAIDRPVLVLP